MRYVSDICLDSCIIQISHDFQHTFYTSSTVSAFRVRVILLIGPPAEGPGWATAAAAAVGPAGGIDWGGDTLKGYTDPRQTIQRPQKDYTKI